MRSPSTFFEASLSLMRLRTTPARKPRTECCCQPVAFIMAAMVAPEGDCSNAITCDCFEPGSSPCPFTLTRVDPSGFAAEAVVALKDIADRFLADFDFADFNIEILHSVHDGLAPPPPKPHLGQEAGGAGSRSALGAQNYPHYRSNRARMPVLSGFSLAPTDRADYGRVIAKSALDRTA